MTFVNGYLLRAIARPCLTCVRCGSSLRVSRRNYSSLYSRSRLSSLATSSRISEGPRVFSALQVRFKSTDDVNSLFVPVHIEPVEKSATDNNVGEEITGALQRDDVLKALNLFYRRPEIKRLAEEHGLDTRLFHQSFVDFRKFCAKSTSLAPELHILLSDINSGAGHVDDLFPYFLQHAKKCFPHLECMDDLRKISDLRTPAHWYSEARNSERKVIFHAGPTNSGKTYEAMEHYLKAKSGIYCGPLKLLANEVFHKANERGVPCDLITGEERRYADPDEIASSHVACTVEMTSVGSRYEVGIIDEIQMIRDNVRGWAWTRAVLGLCVDELHICGEASAIELVKELLLDTGEELEVRSYKRLTPLTILDTALQSFDNIRPGDCVVAFNKNDIYSISRYVEQRGMSCAVIYGGLPPGTKLAQAKTFNDPNSGCDVLVATDAIGMGLNLSIKRIIFYSLMKPSVNEKGEKEIEQLTTSQALQIAGRAGRYRTQYQDGEVTTFRQEDVGMLKEIMSKPVDPIEAAGLHPTADQIELFAYHLPNATLSNLMDIFVSICRVDASTYFMCNIEDFKFLADTIQHVPLALKTRYVFCCAPISRKMPFVCSMFLKFARQFSRGEALTFEWVAAQLQWPFAVPETIAELQHLENVFDVFDLYLWLTYRFKDMFPDTDRMRVAQQDLDRIIHEGVSRITKLILQTGTTGSEPYEDVPDALKRADLIKKTESVKKTDSAVGQKSKAANLIELERKLKDHSWRRPRGTAILGRK